MDNKPPLTEGRAGLFRDAAIQAVRHHCFGPVAVVAAPGSRALLAAALGVVALLVLASIVIEVPDRVTASGVLAPERRLIKLYARRAGWVTGLAVANGERVRRDQALLRISDERRAPDQATVSAEVQASLQQELQLLQQSLQQQLAEIAERRISYEQRKAVLQRRLAAARTELQLRERQIAVQARRTERLAQLAESALVAKHNADEAELAALQIQAGAQALHRELMALQAELEDVEAALRDADAAPPRVRTAIAVRREELQRLLSANRVQAELQLLAPRPGQVAGLTVRDGSFVQAGQLLLTLHEPDAGMQARLFVSAAAAGRIEKGLRVELTLDAFPHQLYGTQAAEVISVSAVALTPEELDAEIPVQGPVFEVRARALDASSMVWRLPPGTVVRAELIRHRWPLYRWLGKARKMAGA